MLDLLLGLSLLSSDPTAAELNLSCLTDVIYYEANSETYEGQLAVATVAMNRVKSGYFAPTICGVVYQRSSKGCQFSWVCGRRARMNTKLYEKAKLVAQDVLFSHKRLTSIGNSLYFHNTDVQPSWSADLTITKQIGSHIFYAIKKVSRTQERRSYTHD